MAKHILVVDDDRSVRYVVVEMLRERGYRVSSATGGGAMRDFLVGDNSVDAVVVDAIMSGKAGSVLALYAKRQLPAVTISGSPGAIEFAIKHNLRLLQKPFRMQELFDALDLALGSGVSGYENSRRRCRNLATR